MNEGDFDKIISKKLKDEAADYPHLDANWQKVKEKMAHLQDQKPAIGGLVVLPTSNGGSGQRKWVIPTLLASLFLLLGTNGWLIWRLSNSMDKNIPATFEKQEAGKTIRRYDTIIETKVIYHYDTVYKKVIVVQPIYNRPILENGLLNEKMTPSVSQPTERLIQEPKGAAATQHTEGDKTITTTVSEEQKNHITPIDSDVGKQTITNHQDTKLLLDSTQSPHFLDSDSLSNNKNVQLATNNTAQSAEKDSADAVKFAPVPADSLELKPTESMLKIINARPKKVFVDHYAIGIQGGLSSEIPVISGIDVSKWIGTAGEIAFKKGLSVLVAFDFSSFHFKTTKRTLLTNLPADPPMTGNYTLKYVEGSTSSLEAGIGIKYVLKTKSNIKPLISAGYMRRWVLPYEAEFEFLNNATGEEKSYKVLSKSGHQDNWLNLGLGLETQIRPRLDAVLKAEYIYDPNHGQNSLNQILLRGGIFYRF